MRGRGVQETHSPCTVHIKGTEEADERVTHLS